MAFGVKRPELQKWKQKVKSGNVAFLTHYWIHPKFPEYTTVTKVGCCNIEKLKEWGIQYDLKENWIHYEPYPHFDLIGKRQLEILEQEGEEEQIQRFKLKERYT